MAELLVAFFFCGVWVGAGAVVVGPVLVGAVVMCLDVVEPFGLE